MFQCFPIYVSSSPHSAFIPVQQSQYFFFKMEIPSGETFCHAFLSILYKSWCIKSLYPLLLVFDEIAANENVKFFQF